MESTTKITPIEPTGSVVVLGCKVCASGQLGFTRVQQVLLGKATADDVAKELGCTKEDIMKHINDMHDIQQIKGQFCSPDFYLDKLLRQYTNLQNWTDYVLELVKGANDIDPRKVHMLIQLSREIRETINTLGEFQGRKAQQNNVYVQQLEKQVEQMTYIVLEETCPVCQQKVQMAMANIQSAKVKPLPEKTSLSIPVRS